MKTLITILSTLILSSCATPPTPEQVQAYANAAHTVVQGGIQDYKEIQPLINK